MDLGSASTVDEAIQGSPDPDQRGPKWGQIWGLNLVAEVLEITIFECFERGLAGSWDPLRDGYIIQRVIDRGHR